MWLRRPIGIMLVLLGLVWFFQGIGALRGSLMTGESASAVIDAVCVACGALLQAGPARRIQSGRHAPADDLLLPGVLTQPGSGVSR
jgi:hypothetical protein